MPTNRITSAKLLLLALVLGLGAAPWCQAKESKETTEKARELNRVLESDAPPAEKAIACKQLAVWGTAESAPVLAKLLPDPELTSWARIALEAIPDPAAGKALRDALETVSGQTLIGVVNSLGVRHDTMATGKLIELMNQTDANVASAAAAALGKIGNPPAVAALRQQLAGPSDAIRSAVAEGCVLCAERLMAEGKASEAAELYEEVRRANVPKQRIIEATRGVILARQADGVPLLIEQLKSSDEQFVAIGLSTARELVGPGVTNSLLAKLESLEPAQKALLILALADRRDRAAMPAMLEAAKRGAPQVRIAAIDFLKQVGDQSCVPVLLEIAAGDAGTAEAAIAALESLPGDGIDASLAARLDQASGKQKLVLIELFGRRRIHAAPALFAAAKDDDPEVRTAALTALGEVVELKDLAALVQPVLEQEPGQDAEAAQRALRQACVRMADREACAEQLTAALSDARLPAKLAILETLAAMGGPKAVATVGAAGKSEDVKLQVGASRLLGSWMSVDAGPVLLELANSPQGAYKVRALRGYIRLARQFVLPDEQRVAMCRKALDAADREAERKLVLEVVQRYPSVGMLQLAVDATKLPGVQDEATVAALTVAQELEASDRVRSLLEELGHSPKKIEIVNARYGAGNSQRDVTDVLNEHSSGFPLIVLPTKSYNAAFGGDPAQGVVKQLKVQYRVDGKPAEAEFAENAAIILPVPK